MTDFRFPDQSLPNEANQCELLTNIEAIQKAIANSRPGAPIQIEFLRLNPVTRQLEKHAATIRIIVLSAQSRPTIGLVGQPGFMIKDIDSSTQQSEVGAGDIILTAQPFGQIADLDSFRNAIRASEVNGTIRAEVLSFTSTTNNGQRRTVSLKLYPYPAAPQNGNPSVGKNSHSFGPGKSVSQGSCPENPCVWCCAGCYPSPWSSGCKIYACETGRINCRSNIPKCLLDFCL